MLFKTDRDVYKNIKSVIKSTIKRNACFGKRRFARCEFTTFKFTPYENNKKMKYSHGIEA